MGFDKHFYEDHCYLDDPVDGVGMNVEIIEDSDQVLQYSISDQKPLYRNFEISGSSNSMNDSCDSYKSSKKGFVYIPFSEVCTDHKELFLHRDEKLVKPGDKFASHKEFVRYLNENAKRWCFYYKCSDSRKPNTEYETYTYNCVYLRNKEKYKKKGLRKRNNNMKTDCPCKIKLRHLPNEKELTVIYVCNHHDHELSIEEFYKLQHGRRLPPNIKEEIMDLLTLKVDIMKIRAYVEMETGFSMSRPFFYALEKNMKSRNMDRYITDQRLMLLKEKIAVVEKVNSCNKEEHADEQTKHIEDRSAGDESTKKLKQKRLLKKRTSSLKRQSGANELISSNDSKRLKIENELDISNSNETCQTVKHLQESMKCEIQTNPWVSDHCVPVLPNRTECQETIHVQTVQDLQDPDSNTQNEIGAYSYTIEYYNPDNNNEIICNELDENINGCHLNENNESDISNIAYETVVTDDNIEIQYDVQDVNDDHVIHENIEFHLDAHDTANDQIESVNEDIDNTQNIEQVENHVECITEETDNDVEYANEINIVNTVQDIGVQTVNNDGTGHTLVPVFDVYMKDGNVTGFVVTNNNLINGMKNGVDKGIQTSEDLILSDISDLDNEDIDSEIIHDISESGNTYIKHEYVHKYNIDKYMVQPHFPKYVETLAKQTSMDVLSMFTNIYTEKAMFKITTTQKGKEGNTRIWYVTDVRLKRQRKYDTNRERLGQNLQSVFLLKEKVRNLKKLNKELASKNKQLEEVALRLVDLA